MGFNHMMAVFNTSFPEGGKVDAITLKSVAMALAARAHSETGRCHPSYEDISAHAQLKSRDSISNALDLLELLGFMKITHRFLPSGAAASNEYLLRNTETVLYTNARRDIKKADAFIGWCYGPNDEYVPLDKPQATPPWYPVWRPRLFEIGWCDPDFVMFDPDDRARWRRELNAPVQSTKVEFPAERRRLFDLFDLDNPEDVNLLKNGLGPEFRFMDAKKQDDGVMSMAWQAGRCLVFHRDDLDVSHLVKPDPRPKRKAPPVIPADYLVTPDDCPSQPTSLPQSARLTAPVTPDDWVVFWDDCPSHSGGLPQSSRMTEIMKVESISEPGSEPVIRTMKAEREVNKEAALPPSCADPFYYQKTEEIEERKANAKRKAALG